LKKTPGKRHLKLVRDDDVARNNLLHFPSDKAGRRKGCFAKLIDFVLARRTPDIPPVALRRESEDNPDPPEVA
jgi:hypothetical protein